VLYLCSFETYGVDPKYSTVESDASPPAKVITIESVPISEYWFKRIFGNGDLDFARTLSEPLYMEQHVNGQGFSIMPKEFDKSQVLNRLVPSALMCT